MSRRSTTFLAAGLATGIAAGAVIAATVPETRTADSRAATPSGPPAAPTSPRVRRITAPATTPTSGSYVRLRTAGPVRIAVRVPDPRGGPDWAVRSFLGERLTPAGESTRVIGRNRCVQLGRLHAGRFGWLDSRGTFRPVGINLIAAPTECLSRRPDLGGNPRATVLTTITDPSHPTATRLQAIVWGLAGQAAREPALQVAGRGVPVRLGAQGELLALLDAETEPRTVALHVRYPARGAVRVLPQRQGPESLPPEVRRRMRISGPAPGAVPRLAAQAPDPDGGLPFGFATVPSEDGQVCTAGSGGRVVDGLLGRPDYLLHTFQTGPHGGGGCPGPRARRTTRMPDGRTPPPYQLGSSSGSGQGLEVGEDPAAGRVARRTPQGRTILSGIADPIVKSLTFASPLDVRTLQPSGPHRAFITVYGGAFPTGDLRITTRFRDGRVRRDKLPFFGGP